MGEKRPQFVYALSAIGSSRRALRSNSPESTTLVMSQIL
jgi:hypothetical protein